MPTPQLITILRSIYLLVSRSGRCRAALLALLRAHPIPAYLGLPRPSKTGWPFSPPSTLPGIPLGGGRLFGRLIRTILSGTVDEVREVLSQCHSNPGSLLSFKPKGLLGNLCLVPLDDASTIKPSSPPPQPSNEGTSCARVTLHLPCPSPFLSPPPSTPCAPSVCPIFYPCSLSTMPMKTKVGGGQVPPPTLAAAAEDVDPILYPLLASLPMPPPLSPSTQSHLSSLIHPSHDIFSSSSSSSSLPPPPPLSQHEYSSVLRALRFSLSTGTTESTTTTTTTNKTGSRGTTGAHKPKARHHHHPIHPLAPGYRSPDMFRGTLGTARVSRLPPLHPPPQLPQWRSGDALPSRPTITTTSTHPPSTHPTAASQVPWGASTHGAILHTHSPRGEVEASPQLILAGDARRTVAALKRAREGPQKGSEGVPRVGGNSHPSTFTHPPSFFLTSLDGLYSSSSGGGGGGGDLPGLEGWGGEWGVGGSGVSGGTGSAPSLVTGQVALQHNTREAMDTLEAFLLAVDKRVVPSLQSLALAGGVEGGRKRREILSSIKHTVVASERARWEGGRGGGDA